MTEKTFTIDEVSKHNSPNDAWVILEGSVYDITTFLPLHPGGAILLNYLGRDAKKVWIGEGYLRHLRDNNVFQILQSYKIGKIREEYTNNYDNKLYVFVNIIIVIILFIYLSYLLY